MLFTPLITLDLVTAARRLRYFIVRVLYATVLLLLLWANYEGSAMSRGDVSIRAVADFSTTFFTVFAITQISAILLLTPAMMAGTIAQERERRTIEYLFASTLSNSEIILSKYLARTIHVASLLLVGLPILAVTMMLGGVDPEVLLLVFLLSVATLLATAALSMGVSVWAKRSRDAVVRTYVFLIAFLVLPGILMQGLRFPGVIGGWLDWLRTPCEWLTECNPYVALFEAFTGRLMGGVLSPWESVLPVLVVYLVLTVVILLWSIASVRRIYRKSVGQSEGTRRNWFSRFRWRPPVGDRPMLWKELFAGTAAINLGRTGRVVAFLLFVGALSPMPIMFLQNFGGMGQLRQNMVVFISIAGTALECGALLIIAVRAAGSVTAEKERDLWISLISTPLTPAEIVWAKILGSVYATRWFLIPLAVMWCTMVFISPAFLLIIPVEMAAFACCALALSAIGTWFSSWARTSIRAMGATVATCVFAGGGYFFCCAPVMFGARMGNQEGVILMFAPCIPFLLAGPVVFWMGVVESNSWQRSLSSEVVIGIVAFMIGTVGYLFVGLGVVAGSIGAFDELAGRTRPRMEPYPLRPPPPRPIQIAVPPVLPPLPEAPSAES